MGAKKKRKPAKKKRVRRKTISDIRSTDDCEWEWITDIYRSADANKVAKELLAIKKRKGWAQPKEVVKRAKKKASAMHGLFDWNVYRAAQKHWEEKAGGIVRSLRAVEVSTAGERRLKRVFVSIHRKVKSGDIERGYVSVHEVREEEEIEDIMAEAKEGLLQWIGRYEELGTYFPKLFEEIRAVLGNKKKRPKR